MPNTYPFSDHSSNLFKLQSNREPAIVLINRAYENILKYCQQVFLFEKFSKRSNPFHLFQDATFKDLCVQVTYIRELFTNAEVLMPRSTFLIWQPIEELSECLELLPPAQEKVADRKAYIEFCVSNIVCLAQLVDKYHLSDTEEFVTECDESIAVLVLKS